jgi:hypothetical protein
VTLSEKDLKDAVVAMTPARVLWLLAEGAAPGDEAVVNVHLSGGQVLGGTLVAVATDRGHDVVVLADPTTGRFGYVLLVNVIAVELGNPGRFADIITMGRLPLPGDDEGITRLALQREFGLDGQFPVQVDWSQLPGSGPLLANLARLLRGLRDAVGSVRSDELGRLSWERVHALGVEHHDDSMLSVEWVRDGLSIYADLTAALPRDLAAELAQKINALL